MKTHLLLLTLVLAASSAALAQSQQKSGNVAENPLLKKFDTNGDGKIDDTEQRVVREKMRQKQNKPGAMTPSGKTETVGNREVTEMEYASSDGRKIPCVLSMPKGEGLFPVLVTIHGGQGNRDLGYIRTMAAPNNLSPTVNAFNQQPWAILAISYRSGNGALFGMEHDDVIAGIRFAKTLPKVDAARVGVVGGSHGGHLALVAAEKMGSEFLCVAVGSPWMIDPVVYMAGDPGQPPLSLVRQEARDELVKNGQSLFNGLTRGCGMSDHEAKDFLAKNSIEANADKIEVPTLFITSLGDDQAPHVLIEPMIERMKTSGKDVSVYTAQKSPHGFYWARTVSAARALRGEKSHEEETEEKTARETIIAFFTKQFARANLGVVASPKVTAAPLETMNPADDAATKPATAAAPKASRPTPVPPAATDGEPMTREQFKERFSKSAALASRPEVIDRLFDRLDENKDGKVDAEEFKKLSSLRGGSGGAGGPRPEMPRSSDQPANPPAAPTSTPTNSANATRTSPVRVASGQFVGEKQDGVRIFRGIPYAAPPVGELRWKAPQPPKPWTGNREAIAFGKPALQGETFFSRSEQSEDCLFLNIWTPADAGPDAKLPVLFWIHGGAFIQGSGAQPRYDGSELARRGIVVITINYRLGPAGLFAHPALTAEADAESPLGNLCLLDMMAALRWTRENISAFGGDSGNVTISGSSAGGTSCLFLMGIPEAHDLFHKAIIHSSGGIRNIQTLAQAEAAGLRLAERLGLDANTKPADLRRLSSNDLAVSTAFFRQLDLPVKPIVDGRLVTQVPAGTFASGKQVRIPVLMGAANGESGARQLADDIATQGAFGFQVENAAHMARAGQPVYLFQLTFVPPAARARRHAAMHGESVAYAFGTIGQSTASQYGFRNDQTASRAVKARRGGGGEDDTLPVEDSAEGRKISEAMLEYWAAFMRTGKPEALGRPAWPAFSQSAPKAMVFGDNGIGSKDFAVR